MEKFVLFLALTLIQVSRQEELPVLEEPKENLSTPPSFQLISDNVKFSSEESSEFKKEINWLEEIQKLFQVEVWTENEDRLLEELINAWLEDLDDWSSEYEDEDGDDWWHESDEWLDSNESDYSKFKSNEDLMNDSDYYAGRQFVQVKVPSPNHGRPFKRFTSV